MSPVLAFGLGFLSAMALVAVCGVLFVAAVLYRDRHPEAPKITSKPYEILDRSDKAVRAMEDRRKSGISAVAPHGTNTVFDMQIEVP